MGTNLRGADLNGALAVGANLTGANLTDSALNGVNFVGANLSGADLRGADLTGVILNLPLPPDAEDDFDYQALTGDELERAILSTPLSKAIFDPRVRELNELNIKALLKDAQLQGVIYNDNTIWPLGFEIPPSAINMP